VQDGFAALVDGSMVPEHRELGYGPLLARFDGDGQLVWAVDTGLVPQSPTWNEDKLLLSLTSGDLIAFMHGDGDQQNAAQRPYSLKSWSADGTRTAEASVGKGLMTPELLELADGRVLLLVSYDSTGAAFALEVLPDLETKPLAQLASWGVWNSVALPDGGFAVGGPLPAHSHTLVGSPETGQVVFEAKDSQEAFVASFDGAGTLRWARRTRGQSGATVIGALPDGGVVARIVGYYPPGTAVDVGDGTSRTLLAERGLAVFGPEGDLRVLQAEPSLGSEYGLLFDAASQTLVAQGGVYYEDVVLGAGQPRQTTLHNPSPTTTPNIPALAIYKYLDH
jgi:hypothetical protein